MNRPKKKDNEAVSEYFSGYNQSCKDWEEFLPSRDELSDIIYVITQTLSCPDEEVALLNSRLEKRIWERLGGK